MSMKKIKCAVIGVGYLGTFHAQKYAALPNVDLVAVCDTDTTQCNLIAEKYGAKACYDYNELVEKVDAVSIVVPTSYHYEVVKPFLRCGVHVLVEKPITSTVVEAQELIKIANEKNVVFQVGHLERFNSARLALEKHLDCPRFIESNRIAPFNQRGSDVSVVLDLMIHDIDIIQGIVNAQISKVDAQGTPILSNSIDIANARISFENGCVANVTASRVSFKTERNTRIFQMNSYLSIDYHNKKIYVFRKENSQSPQTIPNISREVFSYEKGDALMLEIQSFIEAIQMDSKPLVSGEDGCRALQTAVRITNLIKENLAKMHA